MKVAFRSPRGTGSGRIREVGAELHVSAERPLDEGSAVEVVLLGADGVDQVRILGVVSRSDPHGFAVRTPADDRERDWIRRSIRE